MTQSGMALPMELLYTFGGAAILLLAVVTIAIPHRVGVLPGSRGHRNNEEEAEEIRADGFIDSFAGEIEEAGGGLPLLIRIAFPGVIAWWLAYLIINWTPR